MPRVDTLFFWCMVLVIFTGITLVWFGVSVGNGFVGFIEGLTVGTAGVWGLSRRRRYRKTAS